MSRHLIIAGTGLFAELARVYFEEYTDYKIMAFACHRTYIKEPVLHGLPVVALEEIIEEYPPEECDIFVAIGYGKMNKMRQSVYEEAKAAGYHCPTFVHPNVKIWDSTTLGDNVFIFEDNTIQPFTSIGNNTIFWSGNHFGHHGKIGDHSFISSHVVISGNCNLGDNIFVGVNSTIRDGLTIADETLIGAGAIVMKCTKVKEVYIPASTKPFPKNSEEIGF